MAHRIQLSGYGLPLPESTRVLASRAPAIGIRAAKASAKPKETTRIRQSPIKETSNPRDAMSLITEYAKARKVVILTYKKVTDQNQIIKRRVEPYSIRIRTSKHKGKRRYFFGFCLQHQRISAFIVDNIMGVEGTNQRFVPRWRVEF